MGYCRSTCPPFLAVIDISDITRYRTLTSEGHPQSPSFWIPLASFITRICTILQDHSPPSLQNLLMGICGLLEAKKSEEAIPELASLRLSISILSLTTWEKPEDGKYLEKLQLLRKPIQDEKSNAILGFAIARYRDDIKKTRDFRSVWEPRNSGKWTALEALANAKVRGTKFVIENLNPTWESSSLVVRVLLAYQTVQDKSFAFAREILEACTDEIKATFGKRSVENLVTATQLIVCYNSLACETKALALAENVAPCICVLANGVKIRGQGSSMVDDCSVAQSMRGVNFAIIVADSFIGLGKYDLARSILIFVWKYTTATETSQLMCLIRLLKINRRQRNPTSAHDCLVYLTSVLPLLRSAPEELVFQCFEEVLCNLGAIDSQQANTWTAWNSTLEKLLQVNVSEFHISKPMMATIESYHEELLNRKAWLESNLLIWDALTDEPDFLSMTEIEDMQYDLVAGTELHHLVRLAALILDSLRSDSLSRPAPIHPEADRLNPLQQSLSTSSLLDFHKGRLVIAIDYGTTHTGKTSPTQVAIATAIGTEANLDEINVIEDWGPNLRHLQKVPSVISYSLPTENHIDDASAELDLILRGLDGMHDLNFSYIKDSGSKPKFTHKKPEEIVQDYLTKVFEHLLQNVDIFTEEMRDRMSVDIIATVPTEWGYRAKNLTFRALTNAGFNKDTFPLLGDVMLVSEPEAAAVYTARFLKEYYGADFLRENLLCYVMPVEEKW
ncbi:hypothetical protein DL98DRAFT_588754 [Cadophora sp. DSE1049]|nr:hypothetical protein DL98DRAFT_588754 [Cadophora sp. DSE1049]